VYKSLVGRHLILIGAITSALVLFAPSRAQCGEVEPTPGAATPDIPEKHQFDFLNGAWIVHNRLLAKRLAKSHDWMTFDASDAFHDLSGDLGSEESFRTDHWPNYVAIGLHLFDPIHKRWTLYWADNRNSPGTMQRLASGTFRGGVGTFYAPDTFNDQAILVRILWIRVDQEHARWEQAFSSDSGKSWETNWTMDFSRP
jgi:hypothetical protein